MREERLEQAAISTTGSGEPRAVRIFCVAILVVAVAIGVGLVAVGSPRPAIGPVLLLALAVALCINRFALFPSEQAATAEAAVLLAAVVAFRDDAFFLGPLAVALLVGPLDTLHWEQRSFLRMAHNAGNRGLAVLAASAGFVGVVDRAGASPVAFGLAIVVATLAFALVDVVLSVTLLLLQGESRRASLRHVLDIDALTVPVAFYGAAVGFLAGEFGWWATALALIPAAFVPEFVLARARWRATVLRDLVLGSAVVAVLIGLAFVVPVPGSATLAVLITLGVLAGLELGVDARSPVPPVLAIVVIAAAVVADGDRAFFAAALVAVTGTLTAWSGCRLHSRPRLLVAVATAAGAGLLVAAIHEAAPRSAPGATAVALAGGLAFESVVVMLGSSRRRSAARLAWTAPLLAAALAWSFVWQLLGLVGGAFFALAMAGAFAAAAWWGAPPWSSRVLGRWMGRVDAPRHRAVLVATCAAAGVSALVAASTANGEVRLAMVWATVGVGESALAMVLVGVRQWRFAPRPRARTLAVLLATSGALALGYPALAVDGSVGAVALVAVLLVVVLLIGRTPGARADEVVPPIDAASKR